MPLFLRCGYFDYRLALAEHNHQLTRAPEHDGAPGVRGDACGVPVTARMLLEQGERSSLASNQATRHHTRLDYSPDYSDWMLGYSPGYSASRENDRLREKFTEKVPNPCSPGMVLCASYFFIALVLGL